MARNDQENGKRQDVHVVDVIRHGAKIVLPEGLAIPEAIEVLKRKQQEEEERISLNERVMTYPWDGAIALRKAIEQTFGVALQRGGFFGMRQQMSVEVGPDETVQVPWGSFDLPGIDGTIGCSAERFDGRLVFVVEASIRRKHEPVIKKLIALTREISGKESIYKAKAIRMKFRGEDGEVDEDAQPKFMNLRQVEPVIFNEDLQREIDTNIMAPILYPEATKAAGTPLKRGVLLAGVYGVGKTLLASNVAKAATAAGWTFLYCEDVRELPEAIQFALAYQPCVVFAEDLDRVASGGRSAELDELLYQLDGIGTKGAAILTIMTTNKPEIINGAVLRPGRVDVPLFIDPPDSATCIKMIRAYGREFIAEDEDLAEAGNILQGRIPAVIREVVERSKLETLSRTRGKGDKVRTVDLVAAARTYIKIADRLQPQARDDGESSIRAFGEGVGKAVAGGLAAYLQQQSQQPSDVNQHRVGGNGQDRPGPRFPVS